MTTAAIYARKSTDDDRDQRNKSVTRQVEHARAYAASKGWAVSDDHVYVDDGISGAEFENRPAFAKLIADLPKRRTPPFDVLVMSEASRLGRDQQRTVYFLAHIRDAGVRIYYYLDDTEERLDTPEQVLMSNVKAYAAEVERMKAGQRARDALTRRAAKGYNAGGVVYGYDNVTVCGEDGAKTHTDYRINDEQADVLRRIFRAYAAGHGHVTIAKALNGDPDYAALSRRYFDGARPTPPRKGTGSWAPSSVRAMLHNERYAGVLAYGEYRKVYRHGTRIRVRAPEPEVQRTKRDDLQIIPAELWRTVEERLAAAKKTYVRDTRGKLWGRPGAAVESKYLLTGFGECACCGRNITKLGGRIGSPGKRSVRHYYGCSYHATRGRTICGNDYLAPMEEADALVIEKIRALFTPAMADFTVDEALRLLADRQRTRVGVPERLDAEARRLRKEIDRFVAAIAGGTAPATVVAEIQKREARLVEIEKEREEFGVEMPSGFEERRLRKAFRTRLGEFDGLLRSDVPLARQALRKVIVGRIAFKPAEVDGARGYRLGWSVVPGALMAGNIGVASPRGAPLDDSLSRLALPKLDWEWRAQFNRSRRVSAGI
jgi:DNA invertase Pin-like site-specific DNA recombinase